MPAKPEDNPRGGNADDGESAELKARGCVEQESDCNGSGRYFRRPGSVPLFQIAACCRIKKHRHDNWLPKKPEAFKNRMEGSLKLAAR